MSKARDIELAVPAASYTEDRSSLSASHLSVQEFRGKKPVTPNEAASVNATNTSLLAHSDVTADEEQKRKRKFTVIGTAAVVLIAAIAAVAVLVTRKNGSPSSNPSSLPSASNSPSNGTIGQTVGNSISFPTNALTWGGNNERNKVYPNAGLDPATVSSTQFGRRATVQLPLSDPVTANGTDSVYAQPIVFSKDGTEYALVVTTGNNVYVVDGVKGNVVTAKNLGIPHRILEDPVFIKAQLDKDSQSAGTVNTGVCRDIVDFVGIVGTPVIDPTTNTAYFFSIAVKPAPDQFQRTMWLYAVDAITLVERDGFPVTIAPTADNNAAMKFDPNLTYQRPGLLLSNGIVYGAFGGHCDLNQGFAGWLIGVDAKTGQITTAWSTVGIASIASGGGAIWHSGAGIALDEDDNLHLVTGTGLNPGSTSFYTDTPATKSNIPANLHESYVKFAVNATTRKAEVVDFMTPAKVELYDFMDWDYGAGAPLILPSSLRGPNGERLTCTMDKPGRVLVHKINDLGGYVGGTMAGYAAGQGGQYASDNVLSVFDLGAYIESNIVNPDPAKNGKGLFEGYFGTPVIWTDASVTYFYFAVKFGPMVVLEWNPATYAFDKVVGQSSFFFSLRTQEMNSMSGLPVVTSVGASPGSAVVWVTDVFSGLYAMSSLPGSDGKIQTLYHDDSFAGGQISRFNIPGFSQTRSGLVYVPTNNGTLLIYGKK
ncbi:hypothetical protein BC830DRAFT_1097437 [Chytriomyces sp. MP71]|nr:hypothetical protein BC830DRAFT_1097437 [Chytriomyces sp. MP71]